MEACGCRERWALAAISKEDRHHAQAGYFEVGQVHALISSSNVKASGMELSTPVQDALVTIEGEELHFVPSCGTHGI